MSSEAFVANSVTSVHVFVCENFYPTEQLHWSEIERDFIILVYSTVKMAALVGISNVNWKLSAAEIGQETDKLIEKTRKVYDQIGSLKQQDVCFESTIKVVCLGFYH